MKHFRILLSAFVAAAALAYAPCAYAYIDPNTGGVIFQVLMPILAVLVGFIAFAWNFVKKQALGIVQAARDLLARLASFCRKGGGN